MSPFNVINYLHAQNLTARTERERECRISSVKLENVVPQT